MKVIKLIPILALVLASCGRQQDYTLSPITISCVQTFTGCTGPVPTPVDDRTGCMKDGSTVTLTYTFTSSSPATCTVSQGQCNPTSPYTSYIKTSNAADGSGVNIFGFTNCQRK